jgi:competence protein ComEA
VNKEGRAIFARPLVIGSVIFLCGALVLCGVALIRTYTSANGVRFISTTAVPTAMVYIAGAVTHPGTYTLPATARIKDVIGVAGGLLSSADPARVNPAAPIFDGEAIYVPRYGEILTDAASATNLKVNINIATAATLHTQLGLSNKVATAIVTYREQHGPYKSVEDLLLVPISQTIYKKISPRVIVA